MIENFITVYENLPLKINGFVMYDAVDDYYTIVLNKCQSYIQNKKTFDHEINHILNGDFCKNINVEILEASMHS